MKKILVTGGADLVGSYLFEELSTDGNEVIHFDNYFLEIKRT